MAKYQGRILTSNSKTNVSSSVDKSHLTPQQPKPKTLQQKIMELATSKEIGKEQTNLNNSALHTSHSPY